MKDAAWLRRMEDQLDAWFFADVSVAPLAWMRLGLGLVAALSTLQYLPHAQWVWGDGGFLESALIGFRDHPMHRWTAPVLWTLVGASLSFAVGFATRATGLLTAVLLAVLGSSGYAHTWGWSTVMPPMVAILSLSAAGGAWSVDHWLAARRGRVLPGVTPRWALRLIQLHVTAVYISASLHRINDRGWRNGEMVYAAVANGMYTRFPYLDPHPLKPLFMVLTWSTELIELAAPVALWVPRIRIPVALGLMAVHMGLEASAIIGWWQPMMCTVLWAFLPPGWAARLLGALRIPAPARTGV